MPHLFGMDRYDSCLSADDGLYCVVKLDLYPGKASELMQLIKEYSAYTQKHYNYTYIERGLYDYLYHQTDTIENATNENRLLMNFSLRKNWRDLVKSEVNDSRHNSLKGLHGIRSVTACLMIIAHVIFINSMGFIDQPRNFEKAYETLHFHLVFNGLMIVQIFFFMAAFLQAYYIQIGSETERITWSQLPKLLFARWWRLTPANAVMIGFSATWMRHLGSGPLWKHYVSEGVVAQCRRFWYLHLAYLNNYQPEDKLCAVQTWHVAADTQMFVFTMLIYLATMSRGRSLALSVLLLMSIAAPALHVWLQDMDAMVLQTPEVYRHWSDRTFHNMHIHGHNNLSSYVIGLGIGTLVYNWQKKKRWGALSWLIIPAMGFLFLTGRGFYGEGERASLGVRLLYAGTHRAAMGLLSAAAAISVTMRLSESFCNFFEWDGWLVPSRLSYSVYLLHMNLVHILMGLKTQLGLVSLFNMLVVYFGVVAISLAMALPFYLVVEAPMTGLLKISSSPIKHESRRRRTGRR
ncbi:unnamed protein product, partial [Iphiclides podalirius]